MKTKYLTLILLLLTCGISRAQQSTLIRVETLSDAQIKSLGEAENAVTAAQKALENVKAKIASEHKMTIENWMEWQSWYDFDGHYILQYGNSIMNSSDIFTPTQVQP